ncbi:ABC transporter ATP-binding protein [Hippea maritima]|uniref:Molybdate-transporting ATPase n=1 Tax=Hippea maritima (strain ATCC 700847 / DSM 10411 / MH2) TaxID=760142 RepID=F2LUU4_HIPMA|nr:ABC transporter ATP-binding protein [Hippea maritima]AEA33549.1 Molybdate-transporting ATPase [Hippea maritima DSM 10411]
MIKLNFFKAFEKLNIKVELNFDGLRNVIFGPSGSGKSSILKMIAGFYNPDNGFIRFKNECFFNSLKGIKIATHKRNVGYLPQEWTLFPHLTIKENILYPIKARKMEFDRALFEFFVNKAELSQYLDAFPEEISGGQKQRVALIRALMAKPKLLLLDEPFSALDRSIAEKLRYFLVKMVEELEIPTIFVSHNLEEAFSFAENMAIIKNGLILEASKKDELFRKPIYVESAESLGFKNVFKIDGKTANSVNIKGFWFEVEKIEGDYCCIRPEDILVLRDNADNSDRENVLKGKISSIECVGTHTVLEFNAGGLILFINIPNHAVYKMGLKKGKNITISLKRNSLTTCKTFRGF